MYLYSRQETQKLHPLHFGLLVLVGIKAVGILLPDVEAGLRHNFSKRDNETCQTEENNLGKLSTTLSKKGCYFFTQFLWLSPSDFAWFDTIGQLPVFIWELMPLEARRRQVIIKLDDKLLKNLSFKFGKKILDSNRPIRC